jgi:hypothetical protein
MYTGFVTSLCLRNSEEEGQMGASLFIIETETRVVGRTRLDIIISEGAHLKGERTMSPQQCPV